MKILVIGPSWIGDMIMSQSLYRTLKVKYPSAKIDVMAGSWCISLLARMPEVHKALLMPLDHGTVGISERWRLGHALRTNQYDHAYVLPNSFKSALVPFFANVPKRTGWRGEMRYGLLNDIRVLDKVAFPLMVQHYVALAYDKRHMRSAEDLCKPLLWPQLEVSKEEITKIIIEFNLTSHRPIIGFCLGAEFGIAKRWPHYHYATLAQRLINNGYQIILLGSLKDYVVAKQIRMSFPESTLTYCINLAGKTKLEHAVILIAACQAIVSNDSGLMHITAALNKPLIALYGPTSPDFTPPLSNKAKVLRLIGGYHKVRIGNADHGYHESLINIQPQQVFEVLSLLLAGS